MGYRIRIEDASLSAALRRIAGEQVDAARDAIAADGPDVAHAVRKHSKKIRGLLRLVRPGFPEFAAADAAARDVARALAPLRDAAMLVEQFDRVLDAPDRPAIPARTVARLRSRLPALPDDTRADARRDAAKAGLDALRAAIPGWSLDGDDRDVVRRGLRATLRKARRALRKARERGRDDDFHALRKQVKAHWYHARLLRDAWPAPMRVHADAADRLGDALGSHHDLSVLCEALGAMEAASRDGVAELRSRALARQRALAGTALRDAALLFAVRPRPLAAAWARRYALMGRDSG